MVEAAAPCVGGLQPHVWEGCKSCVGGLQPDGLRQLVVDQLDVAADAHAAGRVEHLVWDVDAEGEHPPRRVVVLGRVDPNARLEREREEYHSV